jgi:hypothetical protein
MAHELPSRKLPGLDIVTEVEDEAMSVYRVRIGAKVHSDRDFTISRVPPLLMGCPALQLPNQELKPVRFCLNRAARVYVAFDIRGDELPTWLRDFRPEAMQLEIEDSFALLRRTMQLYSREYDPGRVALGSALPSESPQHNYLLFLRPLD